jgi:cytosine/adenosine deaminase-related metal-dependent hydrolase
MIADATLLPGGIAQDAAILVEQGAIAAIGPAKELKARHPDTEPLNLPGQVLMPGFVNAHQHGKGLSSLQYGFPDDILELWLTRSRRRRSTGPYWVTLLGALEMAANGVTAAIQANTPYLTGDFTGEMRSLARAFETAGMRAMIGLGARDRAEVVYPHDSQATFLAGLPADLRTYIGDPTTPMYAGDAAATIRTMDVLQGEFAGNPLVSFAYAPAGPQWVSDRLLSELCTDARQRHVGVHMHGLESHAQAAAVEAVYPEGFLKHLESLGALSERLSLAHAVWLTADDAARARDHRVTLVRNPGSNLRLRSGIAPLAHYLHAGVNVALGSDSGALHEDEDLFKELRLAAGLARSPMWDGEAPPTPVDFQRMTTRAGAQAMQLGARIGALEPGMRADIIAVSLDRVRGAYLDPDTDLATALYARAHGSDVRLTMVEGRIIYRDGVFPHIDRREVAAKAAEEAAASRIEDAETRALVDRLVEHVAEHYRSRHKRLHGAAWTPLAESGLW